MMFIFNELEFSLVGLVAGILIFDESHHKVSYVQDCYHSSKEEQMFH